MTTLKVQDLTLDPDLYPRSGLDEDRVLRYRGRYEAGETPRDPIVVLADTTTVLDGWHRVTALTRLGREEAEVEYRALPEGMTPRLFAASITCRSGGAGDLTDAEAREIAVEFMAADEARTAAFVADALGYPERTVRHWCSGLTEQRRERAERRRVVRRHAAALLLKCGLRQTDVAQALGMKRDSVAQDVTRGNLPDVTSLITDRPLRAETLAAIPTEHRKAALAALTQAEKQAKQKIEDARERAARRQMWGDALHGARMLATWAEHHKGYDPEATTEEITALFADITAFTDAPGRPKP